MFTVREDTDLRRHERVDTTSDARVSIDGTWYECKLSNISGGGAFVEVATEAKVGDAVILMADDLGLVAATIQRIDKRGFSMTFGVAEGVGEDLTDRLTAFLNARHLS